MEMRLFDRKKNEWYTADYDDSIEMLGSVKKKKRATHKEGRMYISRCRAKSSKTHVQYSSAQSLEEFNNPNRPFIELIMGVPYLVTKVIPVPESPSEPILKILQNERIFYIKIYREGGMSYSEAIVTTDLTP